MGIHKTARSAYLALNEELWDNPILDWKWFFEQEVDSWSTWVDLSPRRRLRLWRRGYTSPYGKLYDFDAHDEAEYLSELQRYRLYNRINGDHRYLLDDKLSQYWMLADYPDHRPTSFGLLDDGSVHGVAGTAFDGDPRPVSEWIPATLQREGTLVLKQLRGLGGKEVLVCGYDDGEYVVDGESVTEDGLIAELEGLSGYLVSEYVRQHEYANDLYPHATNTIRVLTVWDDVNEQLVVPMAVQRIGTEQSRPVDNVSRGGLTAEIDRETGELSAAAQFPFSGDVPWHSRHPDTGAPIEGTTVAQWNEISETVDRLARDNTAIPIIGWDVLLDDAGDPVVIEANTGTELDLIQVHRPLLADPEVAAVVSRYLPDVDRPSA